MPRTCARALCCVLASLLIVPLPALAADAPKPATVPAATAPASAPAAKVSSTIAGDLVITIQSATVDYVPVKLKNGNPDGQYSQDKLLLIKLEIHNGGKREATYKTWNGAPGGKGDRASLGDSARHYVALADFGELEAVGITHAATIKPGESADDVLAFAKPEAAGKMTLFLPGANVGVAGYIRLELTYGE